ncbi:hypothetical protein Pmani_019926 [Petrolisthes manimaculis]|uniref:Uncharacterized protein n=1 Tax=Petrolisthes manimaculis TaxID=1843537 RepID=A0AAE1PH71_9EUCA|nr:hypothetical protein Pmani_019926 [Petrolisthes manimaculis]
MRVDLGTEEIVLGDRVTSEENKGWKEQTDWKEESEKEGRPPRRGPHLLPGLPTNISVTAGRMATLPCRVANLKGRAVSAF